MTVKSPCTLAIPFSGVGSSPYTPRTKTPRPFGYRGAPPAALIAPPGGDSFASSHASKSKWSEMLTPRTLGRSRSTRS
jgi:hypothetical protein